MNECNVLNAKGSLFSEIIQLNLYIEHVPISTLHSCTGWLEKAVLYFPLRSETFRPKYETNGSLIDFVA